MSKPGTIGKTAGTMVPSKPFAQRTPRGAQPMPIYAKFVEGRPLARLSAGEVPSVLAEHATLAEAATELQRLEAVPRVAWSAGMKEPLLLAMSYGGFSVGAGVAVGVRIGAMTSMLAGSIAGTRAIVRWIAGTRDTVDTQNAIAAIGGSVVSGLLAGMSGAFLFAAGVSPGWIVAAGAASWAASSFLCGALPTLVRNGRARRARARLIVPLKEALEAQYVRWTDGEGLRTHFAAQPEELPLFVEEWVRPQAEQQLRRQAEALATWRTMYSELAAAGATRHQQKKLAKIREAIAEREAAHKDLQEAWAALQRATTVYCEAIAETAVREARAKQQGERDEAYAAQVEDFMEELGIEQSPAAPAQLSLAPNTPGGGLALLEDPYFDQLEAFLHQLAALEA